MNQPDKQMTRHLQITITTAEYQAIIEPYKHRGIFSKSKAGDDYWEKVPTYLVARCPLCGATYTEKLDTYSLAGWIVHPSFWDVIYADKEDLRRFEERERFERLAKQGKLPVQRLRKASEVESIGPKSVPQRIGCTHFVAVQFFINLNEVIPRERDYFSNQSEVPYVMPVFLPDDIESYVVMHSLPICRMEKDQFVPRYSVYILTYYSLRSTVLKERRKAECRGGSDGDGFGHFTLMRTWRSARETPEAWDLTEWVKTGKLLWLDVMKSDLPLKAEPIEDFPYPSINGIRKSHIYRKGKLKIDPY